jgi:hypothetical protein
MVKRRLQTITLQLKTCFPTRFSANSFFAYALKEVSYGYKSRTGGTIWTAVCLSF